MEQQNNGKMKNGRMEQWNCNNITIRQGNNVTM